MINQLTFNRRVFSWEEIKSDSYAKKNCTPYELETLLFCHQWLRGDLSFEVTTSGSTGIPKKIQLTRSQFQASAQLTGKFLDLVSGDQAFICLDTRYIAGKMMLIRGFELELDITIVNPSSYPFADFSLKDHIDFIALVPLQLYTIFEKYPAAITLLDSCKAILVGGASLSVELEKKIQELDSPVYATFGMTETVSHIALRRINGSSRSDIYTILDQVKIGVDERGCLTVVGPMTNNEIIYTNDQVELINSTQFKWIGRLDWVINSGGIKIHPEKIEKKIEQLFTNLNISNRFFITGIPDERLGEKVILVIEGEKLPKEQGTRILSELKKEAILYDAPQEIIYFSSFYETPTGKLDRKRITSEIK